MRLVKNEFGSRVELNLLIKDYDVGTEEFKLNIHNDDLDRFTADGYSGAKGDS